LEESIIEERNLCVKRIYDFMAPEDQKRSIFPKGGE